MKLGERIKMAREAKNVSQTELGEKLGITQAGIGRIEKSDSEKSKHTRDIATILGCSYSWLADGTGTMEAQVSQEPGSLDKNVLTRVIERVDREIDKAGVKATERDRAVIYALFYEHMLKNVNISDDELTRLIEARMM